MTTPTPDRRDGPTHQLARFRADHPRHPGKHIWIGVGAPRRSLGWMTDAGGKDIGGGPVDHVAYESNLFGTDGGFFVIAADVELLPQFGTPAPISFAEWLAQGEREGMRT